MEEEVTPKHTFKLKKEKEKLKNDQQYQGITKGLPVQKETEEGIAPLGETPTQSKEL